MDSGIYLFRNLSIYTNAIKSTQGIQNWIDNSFLYEWLSFLDDIHDCILTTKPSLSNTEQLILPDNIQQDKEITKDGAAISGRFI
jgi:hypothetical protein